MNKEEKEAVIYLKKNFRDCYEKEKIYLSDFNENQKIEIDKLQKENVNLKDIILNY